MTTQQFAGLQHALEVRQTELEELLRHRGSVVVDTSADMLDQIQGAAERDMAMGNLERDSTRLRDVRAALRRIHLGTFGTCLECGEEIGLQRLAAIPWAEACRACQEKEDLRNLPYFCAPPLGAGAPAS